MHYIIGAVVGSAVTVFCPALARKVKSYFASNAKAYVAKAEATATAEAKKL
jgi:hypothetical protein